MAAERSVCDAVLVNLRRIIRAVDVHSRVLAHEHGLTGPQLVVLNELAPAGGMRIGELARRISLSHATVSGVLDRLEKRGLVNRTRGGPDRRGVTVGLTESGRAAQEKAPPLLQETFLAEFGKLSEEEQTQILSALQRVASMMAADKLEVSPILVSGPSVSAETPAAEPPGKSEGTSSGVSRDAPEPDAETSGPATRERGI